MKEGKEQRQPEVVDSIRLMDAFGCNNDHLSGQETDPLYDSYDKGVSRGQA